MDQGTLILKALQQGRKLTPMDALQEFGCYRLAARINELRRDHDISSTMHTNHNGKRYAIYELELATDEKGQRALL